MTYEEAKTRLEKIYKNMSDGYTLALEHGANKDEDFEYEIDSIAIAMDCIEKQIPKKPNTREQGSTTVTRGFCTECLRTVFSFDSYCPDCGQAIDWSDEE